MSPERKGWLARAQKMGLTANLGFKATALGLSILLWFFLATQEKREVQLDVPLVTSEVPPGLVLSGRIPTDVTLLLRGRRAAIERISPADVAVRLDLSRFQAGSQIALLDEENVEVPFGVEVARITPSQLFLRLDSLVTRTVPIVPQLAGSVPEGYELLEYTATPNEARVRGPQTLFDRELQVGTEPIPLQDRKRDFSLNARPRSTISQLEILAPELVKVEVRIREIREQRVLQVPVELVGESRGRVQINPQQLSVTVEGPRTKVRTIRAEELIVSLEVGELVPQADDYRINVEARFRRPKDYPDSRILQQSQQKIDVHVYP